MSTKNLIKKENKFAKEHIAVVVSNDDPLRRGRLLVKIAQLMGNIPFWTNCTNQIGKVNLQLIPEPEDIVTVRFRNKDIYSGEWLMEGSPIDGTEIKNIDPKKYGLYDSQGNLIIIDRASNNISVTAMNDYNIIVKNCCNIIVEKDVNLTVNGNVTSFIKGNVESTIEGDVTSTIKGKVESTIEGDVTSTIKGNLTSTVDGNTTHTCNTNLINGSLHVTGLILSDTEVKAKDVTLTQHIHKYTQPMHAAGTGDTTTGVN